jgi:hypothetical protein
MSESREIAKTVRTRTPSAQWVAILLGGFAVILAVAASACGAAKAGWRVTNEAVILVPPVNAGGVGWCVLPLAVAWKTGGCPATLSQAPVVAQTWSTEGQPAFSRGVLITTDKVATVSVRGSAPLVTHRDTFLPAGLRAVVVESSENVAEAHREFPPSVVSMNSRGETISQSRRVGQRLSSYYPVKSISAQAGRSTVPCAIRSTRLGGLTFEGGSVTDQIVPYRGVIKGALQACASVSYRMDGWSMLASLLIDGEDPGSSPPPLPAMQPLPGHAGVFIAPGEEGPQVARRSVGGWLVVSKGQSQQQRTDLLMSLRATVNAAVGESLVVRAADRVPIGGITGL